MFQKLNFPLIELKTKVQDEKIYCFDVIRKKYLLLTPEEWVRQHLVHYLVAIDYPKGLIAMESGLRFNNLAKRTDIVVRDREGQVFMLVECKAPSIKLTQKVIEQASVYNQVLNAKYLAITNGMSWYCFEMDYNQQSFVQVEGIPSYK